MMTLADNIYLVYGSRILTGLGNGILTSSVYVVEVVTATRRGSVVMVSADNADVPVKYWPLASWCQTQIHLSHSMRAKHELSVVLSLVYFECYH